MKKSIGLFLFILVFNSCSSVATDYDEDIVEDDNNVTESNITVPIDDVKIPAAIIIDSEDIVPTPEGITKGPPTPPAINLRGIRGENQETEFKKD